MRVIGAIRGLPERAGDETARQGLGCMPNDFRKHRHRMRHHELRRQGLISPAKSGRFDSIAHGTGSCRHADAVERQTTIETTSVSPWPREKSEMSQHGIHVRHCRLGAVEEPAAAGRIRLHMRQPGRLGSRQSIRCRTASSCRRSRSRARRHITRMRHISMPGLPVILSVPGRMCVSGRWRKASSQWRYWSPTGRAGRCSRTWHRACTCLAKMGRNRCLPRFPALTIQHDIQSSRSLDGFSGGR